MALNRARLLEESLLHPFQTTNIKESINLMTLVTNRQKIAVFRFSHISIYCNEPSIICLVTIGSNCICQFYFMLGLYG